MTEAGAPVLIGILKISDAVVEFVGVVTGAMDSLAERLRVELIGEMIEVENGSMLVSQAVSSVIWTTYGDFSR